MFAKLAGLGPLLIRLTLGVAMVVHGYPKLLNLQDFINGSVAGLGLPYPTVFGVAAALSETVGGLLLILGLFTEVAAFFVACVMAVAVFGVHWPHGYLASNRGFEYPLALLACALSLVFTGPGLLSVGSLRKG